MSMTGAVLPGTERETRQRQLLGLGRLILQQARAGQWDAVWLADQRLAQLVAHLNSQPALWQSLMPARDQVRHWHREAFALCEQETALRKQEWDSLSRKREGLQAYDEAQTWA